MQPCGPSLGVTLRDGFTSDRVPVSLGILLDASDSMFGRRIADARGAIDHFVTDLLDPGDEFALLLWNLSETDAHAKAAAARVKSDRSRIRGRS